MAATQIPAKIVMKGTSKMSLNDRFTKLGPSVDAIAQPQTVRRQPAGFVDDMEHRPTVVAALYGDEYDVSRKKSAFDRLGVRVRDRLGGALHELNNASYPRFRRPNRYRGGGWRSRFRGGFRRGGRTFGNFGDSAVNMSLSTLIDNYAPPQPAWPKRNNFRPRFQGRRGASYNRVPRGNWGYRRQRGGFNRRSWQQRPSKDELDKDLDEYLKTCNQPKVPKEEFDMDALLGLL